MHLNKSNASILEPIQERMRKIAEGLDEDDQADLLELDVLWRNGVFCKPLPVARRTRRRKFVPRVV